MDARAQRYFADSKPGGVILVRRGAQGLWAGRCRKPDAHADQFGTTTGIGEQAIHGNGDSAAGTSG